MEIAIIADDKKKGLLVEFCLAYLGILSKHRVYATSKTAKYIQDTAGLKVESLSPGDLGGIEQLTSRISYNEIDLLIFLRDPLQEDYTSRVNVSEVLRACDLHNIPVATNIGTAEVIVHAIERGDFGWREIENPRSDYNMRRKGRYYK